MKVKNIRSWDYFRKQKRSAKIKRILGTAFFTIAFLGLLILASGIAELKW